MAIGLADAVADAILDAFANNNAYAGNAALYIQMHTGGPGVAGTNHVAGESTRKAITWGTPAAGVVANANTPTWSSPAATESWTNFSLWSASSGGTFLGSGQVSPALAVTAASSVTVAAGAVTISLNEAS